MFCLALFQYPLCWDVDLLICNSASLAPALAGALSPGTEGKGQGLGYIKATIFFGGNLRNRYFCSVCESNFLLLTKAMHWLGLGYKTGLYEKIGNPANIVTDRHPILLLETYFKCTLGS